MTASSPDAVPPAPGNPGGSPGYPTAERLELVEDLHGHRVADPYRWLEDPADPRTVTWAQAQDQLLDQWRPRWTARDRFRRRLAELLGVGMVSVPIWRRERVFFQRRTAEQEHAVLLTRDADGHERVLVDPMAVDASGTTTLDSWSPSPDGRLLAYALSAGGTEDSELRVLDVATGGDVDGPIERVRYSGIGWLPDGSAFYYARHLAPGAVPDDNARLHRRVHLHRLGADPETDVLIFGAGSQRGRYFSADVSRDGRWLTITQSQGTDPRNDCWVADLTASSPDAPELRELQVGVDAWTAPRFHNGRLYLRTDRDAPRGRICTTPTENLNYGEWRDLIPEDPEAVLDSFVILDGAELTRAVLLVCRTRHAISELTVHALDTGDLLQAVALPGLGSVVGMTARPEGGHEAWLSYTDYATPSTVYRYDARTGVLAEWARPPGAVAVPALVTSQVTYPSKDGTPVRMFVTRAADAPPGPRPTILYGYGGFNIAQTPAYSASIVSWVEAGGAYAVANLRGGSEEGEEWHRAGMLDRKQNVFDDFSAAADWLVDSAVTPAGGLAIFGGSNGGLLVGAAVTQRPERYAAAVCSAPLLDMVRYELFGLGSTWAGEYGTASDPEQLGWLLRYSPYHNVRNGVAYPAVLFTVFDGDTRVDPLHARKLVAALQHAATGGSTGAATPGGAPILLRRERDVGHAGRSVSRTLDLAADQLAFLAAHTGLVPEDAGGV
ncbi:MAG TPA: prolyl oligopeptidase family serine peptidase [Micromonosporaceae bacterium]|nr:prolyl oligopeptidase family serine peptidase [Micromonosporaceae bacterium]